MVDISVASAVLRPTVEEEAEAKCTPAPTTGRWLRHTRDFCKGSGCCAIGVKASQHAETRASRYRCVEPAIRIMRTLYRYCFQCFRARHSNVAQWKSVVRAFHPKVVFSTTRSHSRSPVGACALGTTKKQPRRDRRDRGNHVSGLRGDLAALLRQGLHRQGEVTWSAGPSPRPRNTREPSYTP